MVKLAVLETRVNSITSNDDVDKICAKMCEYAKEDGIKIINNDNPNLCDPCNVYETRQTKL